MATDCMIAAPAEQGATSLRVYRSDKSVTTITGGNLAFSVVDGALVVTNVGEPVFAFAAAQWLSVNVPPV